MTKSARVNGERIRALRSKRGLSQKELAGKVKVDPGTVSRWERGEIDRVRHDVFGRLCAVLSASEAEICGEGPLPENRTTQEASAPKGQMNLSVNAACRNALSLVALRYGVTRQQIVEAAPLLFYIVAEQSLKQRRECLRRLEDAADTLVALRPAHLLPHWPLNEEVLGSEEDSIEHRDLFGSRAIERVGEPDDWDEETENPFAAHLSRTLREVNSGAEPVCWTDRWEPKYRICAEEAGVLVGHDPEAIEAILSGTVPLHEMPAGIRKASPIERANWARSEAKSSLAAASALLQELGL